MSTDDEATPEELCNLGEKDVLRLTGSLYAAAGRKRPIEIPKFDPRSSVGRKLGRGPYIPLGSGYDCFKNSYLVSDDSVRKLVVPYLIKHPESELKLAFLVCRDSNMFAHAAYENIR